MQASFNPGSLVSARGREWIVLPESDQQTLRLRPLGGGERDETLIYLPLERQPVQPATFPWPTVDQARNHSASQMLLDALQLKLREDAWVEITTFSGERIVSQLIKGGTTAAFDITEPSVLVVGNAAAVEARLRGQLLNLKAVARDNVSKLSIK